MRRIFLTLEGSDFYSRGNELLAMKCTHCGRELVFYPRTDRASGAQVEVYRCIYCGTEMREYRPMKQIGR